MTNESREMNSFKTDGQFEASILQKANGIWVPQMDMTNPFAIKQIDECYI